MPTQAENWSRTALFWPLKNPVFRLMWLSEGVSVLGDQFFFIALTWLSLELTGSGLALGGVLMAGAVPRALFMIVGGAVSDRMSPRSTMLTSNAARAAIVGLVALLSLTGNLNLWELYVCSAMFGVSDAFFYPAASSVVPYVVEEERLSAGNAILRGTVQVGGLVGPAPAGVLVAALGAGAACVVGAIGFAVSAVVLTAMGSLRRPRRAASAARSAEGVGRPGPDREVGLWSAILQGLRYSWSDPAVRALVLIVAAIDFSFVGPVTVGLAWMAERDFGGASAYGTMLSGFGGGALLGTVIAGSMGQLRRRGLVLAGMGILLGSSFSFMGVMPSTLAATALVAVQGLGGGFFNVVVPTWLQLRTDPRMLGRVMSLIMLASAGLSPFSFAIAGAVVERSVVLMFAVAGGIVVAASVAAAFSESIRSID